MGERLPLSGQKVMNNLARRRLHLIANALAKGWEQVPEPGWMTGVSGIATFFFTYSRSEGSDRFENLGYLALEKTFDAINQGFNLPSFASGLTGMRWNLHYLGHEGFIQPGEAAALDDLEPMLYEFALNRMKQGDYDVLHGGMGYLVRPKTKGQRPKEGQKTKNKRLKKEEKIQGQGQRHKDTELMETLWQCAIQPEEEQLAWETSNPKSGQKEINLGLAHGVPSILLMLSQYDPANKAIGQIVDFLLSTRLDTSKNGSVFAHRLVDGQPDQPGRLAWCYGDPGVGTALWQSAWLCGHDNWQLTAIDILRRAAMRRNEKANRLHDACLCHGTAGLALLFNKMFQLTGQEIFLDAATYWLRATIDHGQHTNGAAGYLFLGPGNHYLPKYSLLEGIAGVGLALIALLDGQTGGWEGGMMI